MALSLILKEPSQLSLSLAPFLKSKAKQALTQKKRKICFCYPCQQKLVDFASPITMQLDKITVYTLDKMCVI